MVFNRGTIKRGARTIMLRLEGFNLFNHATIRAGADRPSDSRTFNQHVRHVRSRLDGREQTREDGGRGL